jgi:hypothetical protein
VKKLHDTAVPESHTGAVSDLYGSVHLVKACYGRKRSVRIPDHTRAGSRTRRTSGSRLR